MAAPGFLGPPAVCFFESPVIRSYTWAILWHERERFVPGVLAVAFSAVLINLQCGLLWGLFAATSIPIDHAHADIWVGSPGVLTLDLGRPIPLRLLSRLAIQEGVEAPEPLLLDFSYWVKPDSTKELCIVIGCQLEAESLGAVQELTPDLQRLLTEPGSIVIDEAELSRLGVQGVGDTAEISGRHVRVVGLVRGLKSLTAPYVFCSIRTARMLLPLLTDQTMFLLGRCRNSAEAPAIVARLSTYPDMSAFTSADFSLRTRLHWLLKTNAGITAGFTAALGLLVGAVVTSQALYGATAAALREYAVLRALGIPRRRIAGMVVAQSFWVGLVGVLMGQPCSFALGYLAEYLGTRVLLPWWLLGSVAVLTMLMALFSGLTALRSLRLIEPATLLR
jgi:putative ABC transport system permease protein